MLAYAYQTLRERGYDSVATEEFSHIQDLFAAILIKGVSSQIKRGLFKDYILMSEIIPGIKGKINIAESIKRQTMVNSKMACEFDNFTEDNILNQILKVSMVLLYLKGDIKARNRISLRKLLVYFGGVTDISPTEINWSSLNYHRNNATYRMLINICWLLLKGMLQTSDKGDYRLADYIDDQKMHRLYEKFLLGYYQTEHPKYRAKSAQISWDLAEDTDKMFLPVMQSDVTLTYGDKVLIIDAKYYTKTMQKSWISETTTYWSHNLYQIFTYVKNMDKKKTGNVSGILLYAKTDEAVTPNQDYLLGDNRIGAFTLDLSGPWEDIKFQLDELTKEYLN